MINKLCENIKHVLIIVSLCTLLTGCDGGIFGTGDGSAENIIVDGVDASVSGVTDSDAADSMDADGAVDSAADQGASAADTDDNSEGSDSADAGAAGEGTEGDNGVDTAPSTSINPTEPPTVEEPEAPVNATPPESSQDELSDEGTLTTDFIAIEDAVASSNGQLSFSNPVVIDNASTEISLLNDTDMNIGLFASQDIDAMPIFTLPPGAITTRVIQPTIGVLYFDEITENNERINQIMINPFSVVSGSSTLTVLANTEVGVRLLAMPSYNVASENSGVPLRFVFPFLAGDPAVPSTITITPDPTAAQPPENLARTFSYEAISSDLPITNYLNVPPGEYLLSDDAGRYLDVSIQVREGDLIRTTLFSSDGTPDRINLNR